jgi:hypothetical protein
MARMEKKSICVRTSHKSGPESTASTSGPAWRTDT